MGQAYIAVLNQAGASLFLKYMRMRSHGQADHCLRLRPAPGRAPIPYPLSHGLLFLGPLQPQLPLSVNIGQ